MEFTRESESPDTYHKWAGLSTVSAVLKRSVWCDQRLYVLFPNLFVALVGPPARTAKSTAIYFSKGLLVNVPTVLFGSDAQSREQLIREMAEGKLNNQCALAIYSSEFSSIIDTSGLLMVQFLTDMFDCNYVSSKGWKYSTKTSGKDTVINPYLTMLVGTTPSYISESMPDNIIGHGFTSRTIFVYEEEERLINPRPNPMDHPLGEALVADLNYIANLHGEFRWTPEGEKVYDEFYRNLYKTIPDDHRIEGYHWRKKIHVLKVAMLLSICKGDDLTLKAEDFEEAIEMLLEIEPNMVRTFSSVGKYEYASELERIGHFIVNARGCPTAKVFEKFYHSGSYDEIRRMIATLNVMGCIKLVMKNEQEWATVGATPVPGLKQRAPSTR